MNKELFLHGVKVLTGNQEAGFSFVKAFMDELWLHKRELSLTHALTAWEIAYPNGNNQRFYYYPEDNEFLRRGLNIVPMMSEGAAIDTSLEQFARHKPKDFWSKSHVMAVPIHGQRICGNLTVRGVVVFVSYEGVLDMTYDELCLYHSILNARHPNAQSHANLHEAAMCLSAYTDVNDPVDVYEPVGESLDCLAGIMTGEAANLRHFSLWEIEGLAHDDLSLKKVFSRNIWEQFPYKDCHIDLPVMSRHYLSNLVLDDYLEREYNHPYAIYLPFAEVEYSIKSADYFRSIGLNKDNTTVIAVVEKYSDAGGFGYVCCYYIQDILYSFFLSPEIVTEYTSKLYKTILSRNIQNNSYQIKQLIVNSIESEGKPTFYEQAAKEIARVNEAEDCLIYLSGAEENLVPTDSEGLEHDGGASFLLPPRYRNDSVFAEFVSEQVHAAGQADKVQDIYIPYANCSAKAIVKSAMLIGTYIKGERVKSVILLINKRHTPTKSNVFFNNVFSIDNFYLSRMYGLFLNHYKMLTDSINSKNYLLQKLRHEIPNCTDSIAQNIAIIRETLTGRPNLLNYARMLELHNNRIDLIARFVTTADFDDSQFVEEKKPVKMKTFLNSYIDIFRMEGKYRGVDVFFTLGDDEEVNFNVSNYMLLAFVNVITNAVRYASCGTCVNVVVGENQLTVTDLGIPIPDRDLDKIFNEGYRSREAKRIHEKGMGYGLYLTRRIVNAHKGEITVESSLESSCNPYIQRAVCKYIESLPANQRDVFIFQEVEPAERMEVLELFGRIKALADSDLDIPFLNNRLDMIKEWVTYVNGSSTTFFDMNAIYFKTALHRVTFTIRF